MFNLFRDKKFQRGFVGCVFRLIEAKLIELRMENCDFMGKEICFEGNSRGIVESCYLP